MVRPQTEFFFKYYLWNPNPVTSNESGHYISKGRWYWVKSNGKQIYIKKSNYVEISPFFSGSSWGFLFINANFPSSGQYSICYLYWSMEKFCNFKYK